MFSAILLMKVEKLAFELVQAFSSSILVSRKISLVVFQGKEIFPLFLIKANYHTVFSSKKST